MRFVGDMMEETRRETEFLLREHRALAREAHADALSEDVASSSAMNKLDGLAWSVADYDDLILPDTVVLASRDGSRFGGLSWVKPDEQRDVIMPLSRTRLLQGRRDGPRRYDLLDLRQAMMRGADAFVVSATRIETFEPSLVGVSNSEAFDELISTLTSDFLTGPIRRRRDEARPLARAREQAPALCAAVLSAELRRSRRGHARRVQSQGQPVHHPREAKKPAAKSWLYGADGEAERHFASIEGAAAGSIRQILATGRPPRRWYEDHYRLINFLMLQWARTPAAERLANAQVDAITKSLLRQREAPPEILDNLDRVKISDGNAMQNAITMALLNAPAVYDLAFKLIDNTRFETAPFVTSDHPVSVHNRLFEGADDLPVTGTGAAGLQYWLPLSPRYGLMFYDDVMYRLGRPPALPRLRV